jgi:dienelactone hydrolase
MTQFQLQTHLNTIYQQTEHQFEFTAQQRDEAQVWQNKFREALHDNLRVSNRIVPANPTTEKLSTIDKGSYIEEKHVLSVDGVATPLYMLIPKTEPPYRTVMAFHGHGMGVNMILGNYDNIEDEDAEMYRTNDENFAQLFAEDGYLVCAIEQQGFGERITNQMKHPPRGNSCRHLAFEYLLHNRTLLGERVWDGMNAISYVLSRDDVIADDLSCVGFSGGGTATLFLSALDERINKVVIASYFCTLKKSILGVEHCECNYVPDLLTLGEIGDIAGLIAPRPVQVISGETDLIFPIEGVREQYARLQNVYSVFDADKNCTLTIHPDAHRFHYKLVASWLNDSNV